MCLRTQSKWQTNTTLTKTFPKVMLCPVVTLSKGQQLDDCPNQNKNIYRCNTCVVSLSV